MYSVKYLRRCVGENDTDKPLHLQWWKILVPEEGLKTGREAEIIMFVFLTFTED